MRFIHFSDVHFDATTADRALASLATIAEVGEREEVNAFLLAGDLFNRGIQNSAVARLPDLLAAIGRLLDIAPVIAISGTPTHDLPGCYAPLVAMGEHEFPFSLLSSNTPMRLPELLVLGLPEPSKEWLLAGSNGLSAEESAARVKEELRKILLGMGAIRAQHHELPAVMLYHGAVEGATLANGQILEGGISIGREDLALVGADYYALGHIHLSQQIDGLPAYYAGSAFPVDWGETEQKGFNLVEIRGGGPAPAMWDGEPTTVGVLPFVTEITRIPFPHPPRQKIDLGATESASGIKGYQVWEVRHLGNGDRFDVDGELAWLLTHGAVEGSRVTVERRPVETVRAAEITEKKHLRDKVRVYADASGEVAPSASVLMKADALEAEAGNAGAETGAHLRIRKLRLRGATGIWKGLGLDEITIDLDRYDAGLIALVGPNGTGKSTLIENMHPWPQLLTREGKLQDHFRLRDSARELWFVDERNGPEYRALMLVDGMNATGKAEYHLFRGDTPLTNGRKEDYEAAIERLFGSLHLFLRSAFVSQRATKNNPDLAEATKGEKKAIFRELAGLDYLQTASDEAKTKASVIEAAITEARAVIIASEEQVSSLSSFKDELARKRVALDAEKGNEKSIVSRGQEIKQQVVSIEAEIEELRGKEADWNAERAKISIERNRILAEHADALKAHAAHEREIANRISSAQTEIARMEGNRNVLLEQIDRLVEDLAKPARSCPQCGYVDPAVLAEREEWDAKVYRIQESVFQQDQEIIERKKQIEAIKAESKPAPVQPALPEIPRRPEEYERFREQLIGRYQRARQLLDDCRDEYNQVHDTVTSLETQVKILIERIADLDKARADLELKKTELTAKQAELAEWRYLERACGPDGIQALELDALGPGIAEVTNRLLSAAYGTRFSVEFRTTRIAGRGSKVKQVEDFAIWIHDSERESEQELSTLSGGESVWIKRALYDAFAIVRDINTGVRFLTCFQDEADGALDSEARRAYFAMLRAAHHESRRRHTLIVTHSQEAQEAIPQQIVMGELVTN